METLKVRQVVFHFDKKSDFRYDVNQNIRIIDLKRMIETALQIPRYKIRLYHNNIEYTRTDDSRLETLFPNLQLIEFKVSLSPSTSTDPSEKEIALKLRLGEFCNQHTYKYPCHFCFDCNVSFCSICNLENLHTDHETIEKYDYLQDTHILVNRIFKRVSEDINNLRFENEENVINFESYLKEEFFDKLRNLISEIEGRIKNLINVYLDSSKNSLRQIQNNFDTILDNCAVELDNRKSELEMENMLIDQSVIVNYYNTILQIHSQKKPIENEIFKFFDLVKSFDLIKPIAENLFYEIKDSLLNKLNLDTYRVCEEDILKNKIYPVNVEKFKAKLRQDILNSTSKKPLSIAKANILGLSPAEFSAFQSGKKKFHHLEQQLEIDYLRNAAYVEHPLKEHKNDEFNLNLQENLTNYISNQKQNGEKSVNNAYHVNEKDFEKERNTENISNSIRNTGNFFF